MIFLSFFFVIKYRFIVFKMTAQIIQSQPKRKKLKKVQGGRDIKENTSKNIDFITTKKMKKNHLRGDLKNMFCHFSKRRWTFEIIFFVKVFYFCVLHPILAQINSFLNFFDFQLTLMLHHARTFKPRPIRLVSYNIHRLSWEYIICSSLPKLGTFPKSTLTTATLNTYIRF